MVFLCYQSAKELKEGEVVGGWGGDEGRKEENVF